MIDSLSVFFGVLAWCIALRACFPKQRQKGYHYLIFSLSSCVFSIQFQVFKIISQLQSAQSPVSDQEFEQITQSLGIMILGTAVFLILSLYLRKKKK